MCGILGITTSKTENLDFQKFKMALLKSHHRGPDSSSIQQINSNSIWGFNRLAILDLSDESMQPFHYEQNYLVFNGAIYNYIELGEYLKSKGITLKTTGDVEVLAIGLSVEGTDFISKLNGMFAFCFYNGYKKQYILGRDKLGVKPLFYFSDKETLIFSSEIKSILEYIPAVLDQTTLNCHLYLDWFIGYQKEKTCFKDVHSIPNGSYYIFDQSGQLIRRYCYYEPSFKTTKTNFKIIEQDFPLLVEQAIELENRSDARTGIILSGGIDTSTNITLSVPHLLKKQSSIPIFTYYYQKKGENTDLHYARKIIDYLQQHYGNVFEVYEYNFDQEITLKDFEDAVTARETPVFDIRYITMTHFFRNVCRSGVKVVLSGQGSDEIYYGYFSLDYWLSKFYRTGALTIDAVLDYFCNTLNKNKMEMLNTDYISLAEVDAKQHLTKIFSHVKYIKTKQKLLTALLRQTMLPSFLLYEDKFSMYSSLEVRVPLINSLLVEYIDSCDYKVNLVSSQAGRHLFRKLLKGKLPKEIIYRGKTPTPKKKYYIEELKKIIFQNREEVFESVILNKIYNKRFLEKLCMGEMKLYLKQDAFYGNIEDVLVELIGIFAFERVYLKY